MPHQWPRRQQNLLLDLRSCIATGTGGFRCCQGVPICLDRDHHVFWFGFDLPLGHWVQFSWDHQIWSNPSPPADRSDTQPRAVDFYRGSHCKALTFGCCKMHCQLCRGWGGTRFLTSELSLVFWRGAKGREAGMFCCFFFFLVAWEGYGR